jgi:hypothetical protein
MTMKYSAKLSGLGIMLSCGNAQNVRLNPSPTANQNNPRRYYVYAHADAAGNYFYVGQGTGRRAWSKDRHPLWRRYVEKHLGGKFSVVILQDDLTQQQSLELEAEWMDQCGSQLVNWSNVQRGDNIEESQRIVALRDATRALILEGKAREKISLDEAVALYLRAIEGIKEYASSSGIGGLVGQLEREEREEEGQRGEIEAIDRLTRCLSRLGRKEDAAAYAKSYFALYPGDVWLTAYARIAKRLSPMFG